MGKRKVVYVCRECGHRLPAWAGRCPECGSWGSVVEEFEDKRLFKSIVSVGEPTVCVSTVDTDAGGGFQRMITGFEEFDRLSGGGVVKGSVSLLSGEPGIGKSTFLLQLSKNLAVYGEVYYVTAEESVSQVLMRAKRIGAVDERLFVISDADLEKIIGFLKGKQPVFVVFDSVQTMYVPSVDSVAGSVSQVKGCASLIVDFSKGRGVASFVVGHVTKEGVIAGPRLLEHMVDAVYHFEGDRSYSFRLMKSLKNRFSSTGEVAVFQMKEGGLVEVKNPSQFFLMERSNSKVGSVIFAGMEGTRALLLEVQALVTKAAFSTPQRRAKGISHNRLSIIIAAIEKFLNYPLRNYDIFVNVVGGITVDEPAIDLPVALAVVSSFLKKPVGKELVAFGEIGLTGEVRSVRFYERRLEEARKNGFSVIVARFPKSEKVNGIVGVASLKDAVKAVFS